MKGLSLLEVLIVLALIGIVAVFAVPSLQFLFFKSKANTQINQLVRGLNFSRNLAIIENSAVMLCPVAGDNPCGADWEQGINIYLLTPTTHILMKKISEFSGAKLAWNRKANTIVFAANGSLSSQNGSFHYQLLQKKQANTKRVILSSTGRIRVEV